MEGRKDIPKFATPVNSEPFPKIEPHPGRSRLLEQHCLLAPNFHLFLNPLDGSWNSSTRDKRIEGAPSEGNGDRKRRGQSLEEGDGVVVNDGEKKLQGRRKKES